MPIYVRSHRENYRNSCCWAISAEDETTVLPQKRTYRWHVTRLRGTPAEFIGVVEAPDEETEIKKAIGEYKISEPWKQARLVGRREG